MAPSDPFDLGGEVALVTGAGQGIGRAVVRSLANHGAEVVVNDIDPERAHAVADEIRAAGGRAVAAPFDVGDQSSVAAGLAAAGMHRVTVLVNNAGVPPPNVARAANRPFVETGPAEWQPYLRISLEGVLLVTRAILPGMLGRGWGRIVTIISEAARQGEPRLAAYAAAKAGAAGFMRSIAREVARDGITANCLSLGAIRTESLEALLPPATLERIAAGYPVGRLGTPEDVAHAVLFLASRDSAWITGQVFPVNGGYAAS